MRLLLFMALAITAGYSFGAAEGIDLNTLPKKLNRAFSSATIADGQAANFSSIGATTPGTGVFTSLSSTSGALNGSIGATTPSTGVFTTGSFTSTGDMLTVGSLTRKLFFAPDSSGVSMFTGAAQTGSGFYFNGASNYTAIYTNATEKVRVDSAGAVRFLSYGAGTLTTDSSGNITAVSDARAKEIIGPFTTGLAAVRLLNPQQYFWRKETGLNTEDVNISLIAQDLISAGIPEAVSTLRTVTLTDSVDDGTGRSVLRDRRNGKGEIVTQRIPSTYYSVNDRAVLSALVNAIKELADQADALESKVGSLLA